MPRRADIRAQLRRQMAAQGVTQLELARRTGIAATAINRFLTGGRSIKLETLERIVGALDLELTPTPTPTPTPPADQSGR